MARFDILGLQYFTDGGELLGGGKLNFYETGTTTRKNTFSDSAMTIANTNPVTLDADGRAPNIFFAGLAKCVLTDSTGVVLETKDPVGDDFASNNGFPEWAADVTYAFNQPVTASDGYIYTSLVNNNIGNDPISSPTYWQLLAKTIGFDDTNNGHVYVVDTAQPLKINAVTKNTVRALVPITRTVLSGAATVDFTGLSSDYDQYEIHLLNVIPANNAVELFLRTSADNGATYDASGYRSTKFEAFPTNLYSCSNHANNEISIVNQAIGSAAGETGVNIRITIMQPSAATITEMNWHGSFFSSGYYVQLLGSGARNTAAAINAVRLYFGAGNMESGTVILYGVRSS
jgi:hypothetical protein